MESINMTRLRDYIDLFYKGVVSNLARKLTLTHRTSKSDKIVKESVSNLCYMIKAGNFFVGEDEEGNIAIYQKKYILEDK